MWLAIILFAASPHTFESVKCHGVMSLSCCQHSDDEYERMRPSQEDPKYEDYTNKFLKQPEPRKTGNANIRVMTVKKKKRHLRLLISTSCIY
jgi:hypothetical protein